MSEPTHAPKVMDTYRQRVRLAEALSSPKRSVSPPRFAPWYAYAGEVPEHPNLENVTLVLELETPAADASNPAAPLGFGGCRPRSRVPQT